MTLTDDEIINIAKDVATANDVRFEHVRLAPTTDSAGEPAMDIKFVLTPGSSASILGPRSAHTTVGLRRQLADAGEERFPIIWYSEE
jgi:hypothetical protein